MKLVKSALLGSAAGLAVVSAAQAADLPEKKAVPIEYVRVCSAYGAGFFYIPGTETCLRVSGRARFEAGYIGSDSRNVPGGGDTSGFNGLLRLGLDARSQTSYGTLRTFLRLDTAMRTGHTKMASGTAARGANAYFGSGQDTFNRVQNFLNVDKAFVQFAGLTAGRASSFFDFYAHDYEIIGSSLGSDMPSTNLLAYTQKVGQGFSVTASMEDPNFRKTPLYSLGLPSASTPPGTVTNFSQPTTAPSPIIVAQDPLTGNATAVAFVDVVQRSRMPDFVGSLRYDAAWGSAQVSAAVKDINTGGLLSGGQSFTGTNNPNLNYNTTQALLAARGVTAGAQTEYGWAVQGGLKFNLPFIAPGDGLYLQGAYGEGASMYTGINRFTAGYQSNGTVYAGNPFNQYLSDAVVNPITGKLELSQSWTVSAAYLHYWAPEWRSSFYGSYGEIEFSKAARAAMGQANALIGNSLANAPGATAATFALSPALRDTNQIVTGASLIWSPVKDLDIGVEGQYIRTALKSGRAVNADQTTAAIIDAQTIAGALYAKGSEDVYQARLRVQRDF